MGVFLAFRYLQSWLHSAWKKEMQRSANRAREEDEYAQGESVAIREAFERISEHFEPPTTSENVNTPKKDL